MFSRAPEPKNRWKHNLNTTLRQRFTKQYGSQHFWSSVFSSRAVFLSTASALAVFVFIAGGVFLNAPPQQNTAALAESSNKIEDNLNELYAEQETAFVALEDMLTELENL
ncbi:hypothetical protein LRY60_01765 [Candidatus Woesebacteria bacterium]|nr:hypothetical protein [Candidatus Woesebacteria bacterium]